mgnify:CR=1 FL=1
MGLAVDTDIAVSLLGKAITDLQSDIVIHDDKIANTEETISGTLKYVEGYTGFSGDVALQSGHYIALHIDLAEDTDNTITVQIIGGDDDAVTLDNDGIFIGYIKNNRQKIKIVAKSEGHGDVTKIYNLSGLVLEPKQEG